MDKRLDFIPQSRTTKKLFGDRLDSSPIAISSTFRTYSISVGTTKAKLISKEIYPMRYRILNPIKVDSLIPVNTIYSGTLLDTTTTQSSPLEVSNYSELHLHLNITSITGSWEIISQTYDSVSGSWADTLLVFNALVSASPRYFLMDEVGVTSSIAFKFNMLNSGILSCSLVGIGKIGWGVSKNNSSNILYLGNSYVTSNTGFPIYLGSQIELEVAPDTEVWGISDQNITANILQL